jgi:hypothetical protein
MDAPVIPLWRNRNFHLLWTASGIAFLGLFTTEIAFPLVILALSGSPALTSLFAFVQTAAAVALGLPAGRLLDRHDRRRILMLVEATRAAAMGTIVAAFWLSHPTVAHLLVVAAVVGAAQPFGAARILLLRAAVPAEQLTAAVIAEEVRSNAAELGGPPLGGLLYGLAQALPFAFAALAFVASTIITAFVRVPAVASDPSPQRQGMFAGLSIVLRDVTMSAVVLMIILINGIAWAAQLTVVVMLQARHTPSWQIGVAVAGVATGGLAGATLVKRLHGLLRPGMLLLCVTGFEVPVLLALALPFGVWWTALMCACFGLGLPAIRVLIDVLIIRQIPNAQRGRALTGVTTLFTLSVPVAMVATGVLLEELQPATTLAMLATVLLLGTLFAGSRPALRRAAWPAAVVEHRP